MGILAGLADKTLYLDANVFVYALEDVEGWGEGAKRLFGAVDAGECLAVTSELTLAECLVKPLQLGRADVVEQYLGAIQNREHLSVVPVSRPVLVEAARVRATSGLKLPDAVHAATALQSACTVFVTSDRRLGASVGLTLLDMRDLKEE